MTFNDTISLTKKSISKCRNKAFAMNCCHWFIFIVQRVHGMYLPKSNDGQHKVSVYHFKGLKLITFYNLRVQYNYISRVHSIFRSRISRQIAVEAECAATTPVYY